MELMLDKKSKFKGFFLFEFKMDCNVVETIPNINTFGPGTVNGYSAVVVQGILQRRQEPQEWEACWLAIRIWQLPIERIVKADPLIRSCQNWSSCKNLLKNSTWTILRSFNTWSKLERWKGCTTRSFMNCVCVCVCMCVCVWVCVCVCVRNSAMSNSLWPWTVACQAPLLIGFSRQEYWSGLPFPPPGNLPNPRIEPGLLHCRWILYCLGHLGSPMSQPQIKKKKSRFEVSSLFLFNNNEPFLNLIVMCNELWILYNWWWLGGGWTEKKLQSTSQSQTWTKKGHGHCLAVCCLSHLLQLSESQWNHYIWEVCSVNWWDAVKPATPVASTGP